jgi:hypothetical protein
MIIQLFLVYRTFKKYLGKFYVPGDLVVFFLKAQLCTDPLFFGSKGRRLISPVSKHLAIKTHAGSGRKAPHILDIGIIWK